jgi:hypothetical protein
MRFEMMFDDLEINEYGVACTAVCRCTHYSYSPASFYSPEGEDFEWTVEYLDDVKVYDYDGNEIDEHDVPDWIYDKIIELIQSKYADKAYDAYVEACA